MICLSDFACVLYLVDFFNSRFCPAQNIITDKMDRESIKDMIVKMEKSALEEWNKGNPSGYLEIYSPDMTYFDPMQKKRVDGFDEIKKIYENLKGKVRVDRCEMINPAVQLSENTAVLSYNLYSYVGKDVMKWNCTEVYSLNSADEWRIIHNHWSLILPQPE